MVSKKYSCLAARASACGRVTGLLFCLVLFGFFFSKKFYWENYKTFTVQSLQSHIICSELTPEKYITTQVDLSFSYIQNILLLK